MEHLNALQLFNEKAEKLENCSFCKIVFGQETGVRLRLKVGEPMKVERKGPDEEAIDAFVLTIRFFIQDNEESSFRNISRIYEYLPIEKKQRDLFRTSRANLNAFLDSNTRYKFNQTRLKYRDILEVFIYGGLSHANRQKKKVYDEWMIDPFLKPFLENEFVYILGEVMRFINLVKNLNDDILSELRRK